MGKKKKSFLELIEKTYGKDFGMRSDKELSKFLKKAGYGSLAKLLRH